MKKDETILKNIKKESEEKLENLRAQFDSFETQLLLDKFHEECERIECFREINIDSVFVYGYKKNAIFFQNLNLYSYKSHKNV